MMRNQTIFTILFFSGLSDLPLLQLPLFLFFLLIYLLTLTWNLLIITLIVTHSSLHTPMYFFLGNLASLDLCYSSVTVPRMLFDLHTRRRMITTMSCITQVVFFCFFAAAEAFLLAVMSYDRYVAICRPLHYMQIINMKACIQLAVGVWSTAFCYSLVHSLYALKLTFCRSNIIKGFFCDLPLLFEISCSDIYVNLMLILVLGGLAGLGSIILTFLPYVYIIRTVLKMRVKGNRSKVFSTCSSHLSAVSIFYGTGMFSYLQSGDRNNIADDKLLSVFYSVATPLLNPLIYSLRNQDFKVVLRDVKMKIVSDAIMDLSKLPFK